MDVPFAKIIYFFFSQIDIYIHKNNSKEEKKNQTKSNLLLQKFKINFFKHQ